MFYTAIKYKYALGLKESVQGQCNNFSSLFIKICTQLFKCRFASSEKKLRDQTSHVQDINLQTN